MIKLRHPTLSEKINAPKILHSLNFTLDPSKNIETLLDAGMPGNQYEFLSVLAMTISMSNSDAVRATAKHHPNVGISKFLTFYITENVCLACSGWIIWGWEV